MFIRVEPNGMMYKVFFVFNKQDPDPEDTAVKDYLLEHGLGPKRQAEVQYNDIDCREMEFGSCYIGPYLDSIKKLHHKGMQQALLTMEIERLVAEAPSDAVRDAAASLAAEPLAEVKAALLERFQVDSSFGIEDGYLALQVQEAQIQEEFLKLAGAGAGR